MHLSTECKTRRQKLIEQEGEVDKSTIYLETNNTPFNSDISSRQKISKDIVDLKKHYKST